MALAAGAVLLTACASPDAEPAGSANRSSPSGSAGRSSPPGAAPTTTPSPTTSTHPEPVDPRALLLTGTIAQATRPQCVVLLSGATRYVLLGVASRPPVGRQVRVIGVVQQGAASLCPGVPLRVRALRPAP